MDFKTTIDLDTAVSHHNLAELLTKEELSELGNEIHTHFEADLASRSGWEKRNEEAMKLALQVKEGKSFPWVGASNVKFPLITIAALQYHSRAYPTLLGSDTLVKCKSYGEDEDGSKLARAHRVENHMSYQVLEEDEAWEGETDKVFITQPILGCAFKKTYYDSIKRHNVSEYVLPKDFVINYYTKSIETASRLTHVIYLTDNEVYERVARGLWLELKEYGPHTEILTDGLLTVQDKSQGLTAPPTNDESTPYEFLEHHRFLDLDGDGYGEPYIVIVRRDTRQVVRIVARFFAEGITKTKKGKVLSIKAEKYFTKFPFIPSPDGGFYDLGFGVLLGPLNDSINTLINQLIDAGTMATTAGGFLSRGIKMRGGNYSFSPLEWKHVESTGDDLRKGILPLPVREPSTVLLQLLELLINYGERIGISVDILTGQNPGQNTPAETSRTMAEQGMKIFSGIFKRTYRALRDEFRLLYRLNQLYITDTVYFTDAKDKDGTVLVEDYLGDNNAIRPSADPHIISDGQRILQAEALRQAALTVPIYNKYEVEKRYLEAHKIQAIEQVLPDPKGPNAVQPPMTPVVAKLEAEKIKAQAKMQDTQMKLKLEALKLMEEAGVNQATIQKLQADAVKALAEAKGVESGHQIAVIEAQLGAAKLHQEVVMKHIDMMMKMADAMKAEEEAKLQKEVPTPK
jgi:chaperonin GroES